MNYIEILKYSFNNKCMPDDLTINKETVDELVRHTVFGLPYEIKSEFKIDEDVFNYWQSIMVQQIARYQNIKYEQERLTKLLEFEGLIPVILKGSSAAMYYNNPAYRIVGDIDIMIFPNNEATFEKASSILVNQGYKKSSEERRHVEFFKGNIEVELHRRFDNNKSKGDIELRKILNDSKPVKRIIDGRQFYSFDDYINGIVLLQHINFHIKSGLGLRQIIDWLMFASKVLYGKPKETEQYMALAEKIGLEKLAVHVQRLGELFFGMQEQDWSKQANDVLCTQLFYVICDYGNFGQGQDEVKKWSVFALSGVFPPFSSIQKHGIENWRAAQKHKILRPFAWIYQLGIYFNAIVLNRNDKSGSIKDNYKFMKERDNCFKELGIGKYRI